jgi:hypothetical protein
MCLLLSFFYAPNLREFRVNLGTLPSCQASSASAAF